ncbi:hypothetical protein AB0M00_16115 [Streptomyces chartreusis]|uniref:hypothetical protein n=1 Tax=Streptomyces TaxID=1883 RepID=UPI00163BB472|nr:hypothetical protein [Streptomyces sp. WAC 01325]
MTNFKDMCGGRAWSLIAPDSSAGSAGRAGAARSAAARSGTTTDPLRTPTAR